MMRATRSLVPRRWPRCLCALAAVAGVAGLSGLIPRPALAGDDPRARAAEAVTPAAPRAPRAPTSPGTPAPEMAPAPAAAPEALEWLELPDPPARIVPRGWFGFGFQCGDCSAKSGGSDSGAVWRFGTWPTVYSVDLGGPAARAGLRRGDVITHIDGVSILTPEGGRRFGAIKPGQTVRWSLLRDGAHRFVVARAVERPERRERVELTELRSELSRLNELSNLDELRRELANLNQRIERVKRENVERQRARDVQRARAVVPARRLRYAGVIGGTEIEVRGPGSVIVSESDLKDEVVINTGEAVVVIRVPEGLLKRSSERKPK